MSDTVTRPAPTGPHLWGEQRRHSLGGNGSDHDHIDELLSVWDTHHPGARTDRIIAAYRLAERAHDGVVRRSGDPYITHPIEVAEITADLGMDEASVAAALMHDVVEDTDVTTEEIGDLYRDDDPDFAADVVRIVDGLTKLDGLHFADETGRRAADLRRMLVAIAADPRVLVVKLADRLHNMRTLSALRAEKRRRIATETLEVFAPLAHRLGMQQLRVELEDLAFSNLDPEAYATIARQVAERRAGLDVEIAELLAELHRRFADAGIEATVEWRVKHLWGIYTKMVRTQRSFDEIFDVVGVRVIVERTADCYVALGVIHTAWPPVPGLVKDYIATPRINDYRSLHTTVWGPAGRSVELQVRSTEMHAVAEWGVAAHWAYKEDATANGDDIAEVAWMRRLLDVEGDGDDANASYIDDVTGELVRGEIYVMTPNGKVVALPDGATPIDFAYQVHSEIGDRAIGARIDGNLAGLDARLRDGDRVEIIVSTDAKRGPNPDWARWVATPKARQLIARWHHRSDRRDAIAAGVTALDTTLDTTTDSGAVAAAVCDRWGLHTGDDLLAEIGTGHVSAAAVAAAFNGGDRSEPDRGDVAVDGVRGVRWRAAECCDPRPPDRIVGWRTRGRGVTVHRLTCTNAAGLGRRDESRIVGVEWVGAPPHGDVAATIKVRTFDHPGVVAGVTNVLAGCGADIRSMSATCAGGRSDQTYDIRVGGSTALAAITAQLRNVDGVIDTDIERGESAERVAAATPAAARTGRRRRRGRPS